MSPKKTSSSPLSPSSSHRSRKWVGVLLLIITVIITLCLNPTSVSRHFKTKLRLEPQDALSIYPSLYTACAFVTPWPPLAPELPSGCLSLLGKSFKCYCARTANSQWMHCDTRLQFLASDIAATTNLCRVRRGWNCSPTGLVNHALGNFVLWCAVFQNRSAARGSIENLARCRLGPAFVGMYSYISPSGVEYLSHITVPVCYVLSWSMEVVGAVVGDGCGCRDRRYSPHHGHPYPETQMHRTKWANKNS